MFDSSLFGDLEPRGSKEENKKLVSRLSKRASTPSSGKGSSIKDKMELIHIEIERHLAFLFDKVEECRSEERLISFVDNFIKQDKGAIDSETLGLDYFNDKIFGWSAWAPGDKSIYVPMLHTSFITGNRIQNQLDNKVVSRELQRIADSNTKLVFHNGKFDLHMIYHNYGVMLPIWWDTMIASRLLFGGDRSHSLDYQYSSKVRKEEAEPYNFRSLFGGVPGEMVPIKTMTPYAAGDTFQTLELQEYQEQEFKKHPGPWYVFSEIEMPLLPIVVEMEERGVAVDLEKLKEIETKYNTKYEEAKNTCYKILDKYSDKINAYNLRNPGVLDSPVNLGSPKQMAVIFYDIIGLEETNKWGRGTGIKVLKLYSGQNEFIKQLSIVRDYEKLVNGFIKSLPTYIKEDGRIHSDFIQVRGAGNTNDNDDEESGAVTGRFSSKNPNMQQIPGRGERSEIRQIFKASEGKIMMSSDFSQQELRVLAHCSNDIKMKETFAAGFDIHANTAALINHKKYEECRDTFSDGTPNPEGKKMRNDAKAVNFGVVYGSGANSISENTGIPVEEAQELISKWFGVYSDVKNWMEEEWNKCQQRGYVETLWGRRREIPDATLEDYEYSNKGGKPRGFNPLNFSIAEQELDFSVDEETKRFYNNKLKKAYGWKAKNIIIQQAAEEGITIRDNSQYKSRARRQTINTIIQGSSADMAKRAMILCKENKELERLGFKLLFPVHDEIIAEAPIENAKRCGEILSQMMIQAGAERCSVPMKCDVEFFFNWAGKKYEFDDEGKLVKDNNMRA